MTADAAGVSALLAHSDDEAAARYTDYSRVDPLPNVPAALLNSADLIDYVVKTGMIHPFDVSQGKLKPASYALALLGKVVWWDPETHERQVVEIKREQEFVLRPNAIAFVTLEPMLRIPDYIAMRFNLRIRNVYRGLLLGTGPLVDPGFIGRLSFPLHNLTTNTYTFRGGDDLIWMEFTKISPNKWWGAETPNPEGRVGYYVPFAKRTDDHDVETYIEEAVGKQQVVSSISDALREATHAAKRARNWTIGGIFAGVFAAGALVVGILALIVSVFALRTDMPSRSDLHHQRTQIQHLQAQVARLQTQLKSSTKPRKK
jgi:deoxycytidine triphosphate deaminase